LRGRFEALANNKRRTSELIFGWCDIVRSRS
jgi:hypothetical protein